MKLRKSWMALMAAGIFIMIAGDSRSQTAEVPFYAEEMAWPNVMIFLDNSGNMSSRVSGDVQNRKKYQVYRDVIAGSGNNLTDGSGNVIFTPHSNTYFASDFYQNHPDFPYSFEQRNLIEDVDSKLIHIFRVKYDSATGVYSINGSGDYFVFISAADKALNDANIMNATMRFNDFMTLKNKDYIHLTTASASLLLGDGVTTIIRAVWEPSDFSSVGVNRTYANAVSLFWDYEKTGACYDPAFTYVVPVTLIQPDASTTWVFPGDSLTYTGVCMYKKVPSGTGPAAWRRCAKPTSDATSAGSVNPNLLPSGPVFIFYNDVAATNGPQVEEKKISLLDWAAANGGLTQYCRYYTPDPATVTAQVREIIGDMPYANWTFDKSSRLTGDGNTYTQINIMAKCPAVLYPGQTAVTIGGGGKTATQISTDILSILPYAHPVTVAGDTRNLLSFPFIKTTNSSDTRLDLYLRTKLGVADATLDPLAKDFGGFFTGLSYDQVFLQTPGIMDIYPTVNYGFMEFDKDDEKHGCPESSFPADSDGVCEGGHLVFNVTSFGDFPAYTSDSVSSAKLNMTAKRMLRSWGSKTNEIFGNSPVSSLLHSFYRYFYHPLLTTTLSPNENAGCCGTDDGTTAITAPVDTSGYMEPDSGFEDTLNSAAGDYMNPGWHDDPPTSPSMYFDLGFPTASGNLNYHIIQDDPFYKNGCRRNYIIFCEGGQQTSGERDLSHSSAAHQKIEDSQQHWIYHLKHPPDGRDMNPYGVKTFVVAFGADSINNISETEFIGMNDASFFNDPTLDTAEFLKADNEVELRAVLSDIMNAIMKGQFARTAPVIAQFKPGEAVSSGVILTTYFDIGVHKLWSGHLIGYELPGAGDTSLTQLWSERDLADILNATNGNSRTLFTAIGDPLTKEAFTEAFATSDLQTNEYFLHFVPDNPDWGSTLGPEVVRVVRGTSGATFANGDTVGNWKLGPIIHSTPRLVKSPRNTEYEGLPGYYEFEAAYASRPQMIYVGTGYGQLHGFKLSDGSELFSYIPEDILKYLPFLWSKENIYGVDAPPVVDDVYEDFNGDGTNIWRTVLLVGEGQGGVSYSALDVTNPQDADSIVPLWNFKDSLLGQTWSIPVMGLIKYDQFGSGTAENRIAAFFSGGVNPTGSASGVGSSFYINSMLDGATFKLIALPDRAQISDIHDTATINDPSAWSGDTNYNYLPGSPVILDANKDKFYDWAYVGDKEGRVWKFNYHDPNPDNWTAGIFYDIVAGDSVYAGDTVPKPIWYTPTLAEGPNNSLLVYFSTGHIELKTAAGDTTMHNRLFAVVDPAPKDGTTVGYAMPIPASFTGDTAAHFPIVFEQGEKMITQPIVTEGILIFKTYLPVTTQACSIGTTRLWAIDYLTGDAVWDWNEGGDQRYTEVNSLSGLSFDSSGHLWDICTSEECESTCSSAARLGDPICQQEVAYAPKVMSWGEGLEWPF
jgi:hypothetical protein